MIRIVYSLSTRQPRRVIMADDMTAHAISQGEGSIDISQEDYSAIGTSLADLQAYISKTTKQPLIPSLYAVVDSSRKVMHHIIADPLCGDKVAGATLVATSDPLPIGTVV